MNVTLYKKDAQGQIRIWRVKANYPMESLEIEWGVLNGSLQYKNEDVPMGLASRSVYEQIDSRIQSRINKQLDKGYVYSLEGAQQNKVTNKLGFLKPMLAKPIKNVKGIDYTRAYVQHKYNGHRCLITCVDGKNIAYSRAGKIIDQIDHITQDLYLEDGQTVDGELYCHGTPLQTISSWIKRKQLETRRLKYHIYDMIDDVPFHVRFWNLLDMNLTTGPNAWIVPTTQVVSYEEAIHAFNASRKEGYEGLILRWGEEAYRDDYRSKHLVKIKEMLDDEFMVIAIEKSKDGWAVLVCETKDKKAFKVTAPGPIEDKYAIYEYRDRFIGEWVTVEYSELTASGIPFHPVAIAWRRDI